MKALLLKDYYVVTKQLKMFFILIVVFAVMPGASFQTLAIVYAALLPITIMAYDERSKWNSLAAMFPYTENSLVLSKYIFAYVATIGAVLIVYIAQLIIGFVKNGVLSLEIGPTLFTGACMALIFTAINLPIIFKFGVEKGRIALFLCISLVIIIGMLFSEQFLIIFNYAKSGMFVVLGLLCLNILSMMLSIKFHKDTKAKSWRR